MKKFLSTLVVWCLLCGSAYGWGLFTFTADDKAKVDDAMTKTVYDTDGNGIVDNTDAGGGGTGEPVMLQVADGYIQWKYESDVTWTNLIATADLEGAAGAPGIPGDDGVDGTEITLQVTNGYIQWSYVGSGTWTNLIATVDLVGAQGPQGIQGPAGPAGPAGADGAQGIQGPAGADGATGVDGVDGAQGIQGPAGADGTNGTNGIDGTDGADGKTILYGIVDPTSEGVEGEFYINTASSYIFGPKGTTWPSGISLVGPQGIQGLTGLTGERGIQGLTGDIGPQGEQGLPGLDGADGTNGIDGVDGNTILYGVIDPTDDGVDGNFYINTATNFIFGPKATTWPSGVSLVGPQGIQGVTGAQGIQGADGDAGENGTDGYSVLSVDGVPGIGTGDDGDFCINRLVWDIYGPKTAGAWGSPTSLIGLQGEQGEAGPQGVQGLPGNDGTDGEDGAPGTPGLPGADGEQGLQGEVGPIGPEGPQGTAGLDGTNGIDGDSAHGYIAYASDASGTDFTTTFNAALDYIAILSTATEIVSPAAGDFAGLWKNYKGATGETGAAGLPGTDGEQGPQGEVGPQGEPGEDGANAVDWTVSQTPTTIHADNIPDLSLRKIIFGDEDSPTAEGKAGWDATLDQLEIGGGAATKVFLPTGEDTSYEPAFDYGTATGEISTDDIPEGATNKYESDTGTNTGDQVGDGVTITGVGTVADPFVSVGGTGGGAMSYEPKSVSFTAEAGKGYTIAPLSNMVITAPANPQAKDLPFGIDCPYDFGTITVTIDFDGEILAFDTDDQLSIDNIGAYFKCYYADDVAGWRVIDYGTNDFNAEEAVAPAPEESELFLLATEIYDFENNGDATIDSGHNLTATNTPGYSSVDYKQGSYSADLDAAAEEYFTLADDPDFDVGADTDYSISFWMRPDAFSGSGNIAGKQDSGNGWRLISYNISGGNYGLKVQQYDAYADSQAAAVGVITNDTWYHVTIAHDISEATEMTIWISAATFGDIVNGATFDMDNDPDVTASALFIGAYDAGHWFDGHLDEFVFFNGTALNATQAEDIFGGDWR